MIACGFAKDETGDSFRSGYARLPAAFASVIHGTWRCNCKEQDEPPLTGERKMCNPLAVTVMRKGLAAG